jgi:uncharacterized membrane protein SpoIIM required for sporulation
MDVDQFITRHRPEWERLEALVAHGTRGLSNLEGADLDQVLQLYQRVSGHLSEARTVWGDRTLEGYLTSVVAKAHAAVYGARPRTAAGFFRTFGKRYREAIHRTGPFIALAALMLAVSLAGTLLWLVNSPASRAGVIPPQARHAIEEATGGADFDTPATALSGYILLNNVRVAFFAFVVGIAFGVPTILILIQNGFIVGALGAGYHVAGKGEIFWSLIVPHGVLELTAIAIAAGAGLRIGWSLIDPGDRPRGRALAEEAADAATVIVGVVPAFILAAVIEGFVTGRDLFPVPVQVGIGAGVGILYVLFLFGLPRSHKPMSQFGPSGGTGSPGGFAA